MANWDIFLLLILDAFAMSFGLNSECAGKISDCTIKIQNSLQNMIKKMEDVKPEDVCSEYDNLRSCAAPQCNQTMLDYYNGLLNANSGGLFWRLCNKWKEALQTKQFWSCQRKFWGCKSQFANKFVNASVIPANETHLLCHGYHQMLSCAHAACTRTAMRTMAHNFSNEFQPPLELMCGISTNIFPLMSAIAIGASLAMTL